jgi:DNA-binding HxlR family transcriptional regulator
MDVSTIGQEERRPGRRVGAGQLGDAVARVGDRWSLLILHALLDGPSRFSDLSAAVPGIAPNILSDRLRRLEGAGVVVSEPYSWRPVRLD